MIFNTPLGEISICFDGELVDFKCVPMPDAWPGVEHAYYLEYDYISDNAPHTLKCLLNNDSTESGPGSGESFESIALYGDDVKMNIGINASFGDYHDYGYDYDGCYLFKLMNGVQYDPECGLEINILKETTSKTFIFGVAWIFNYTDENEYLPWYAAEPNGPREIK